MSDVKVSVVVPTHDRPDKLNDTLSALMRQSLPATDYEIVVVDDGSALAVTFPLKETKTRLRVVRLDGVGRSAARNAGVRATDSDLLVFIDDDISVGREFLESHLRAHIEWPDALVIGSIRLPDEAVTKPFGRFRQTLEDAGLPQGRGPTSMRNFCTAANMSISHRLFEKLRGFDHSLASSEDQDFALRHTSSGGRVVFIPEAKAVHCDSALDIRSYCRRAEWGTLHLIPFCQRYPDWPDNLQRERVNGPLRLGREPAAYSLRKMIKAGLGVRPLIELLFGLAKMLERNAPGSSALSRVYRLLLGIHIFRGYRRGIRRSALSQRQSAVSGQQSAAAWLKADR